MQTLTLVRPDDWHLHLRDGPEMASVLHHTVRQFGRAIVMPNLKSPVTTTRMALDYAGRIRAALSSDSRNQGYDFEPLMTLYLTDLTSAAEIDAAHQSGVVKAVKLYPAGATTNAEHGVTDIGKCDAVFERMQSLGMVLCVHGEVADPEVDPFDREAVFIDCVLIPLRQKFPQLRIVFEHITTRQAVDYITQATGPISATVTPQHLRYSRRALFQGGLRPHFYCLPVLKREEHRKALVSAVASGNPRFFLGTDSAPHEKSAKENTCGCAGCFTAPYALEMYLQVFEEAGALNRFEAFASFHGADFYGLPRSAKKITLHRTPQQIAESFPYGEGRIVPLAAGEQMAWSFKGLA